ncbi:MAG: NADH-quinone oxidoreductase subunit NuoE [Dehalococcoidia bacterium]|nr:NADH-quinone oxidoreductase subunit NuoE [Dehalococcoidia bacterium]RLC65686.1 MAG: NADH-quinone oxidoreductase subunit NuoE [Chloroflexota bacterium]
MFQEVSLKQAVETKPIKEEASKAIDSKTQQQIKKIIEATEGQAGAPIRVLQKAQGLIGYLPREVLEIIAREMRIPLSEMYGITSFYSFFSMVPKGKYVIQVCLGTSCYVKGGQKIIDTLKKELGLESGGTTADGRFSLQTVRCIGCCGLSPVLAINEDIHRRVKPSRLKDILSSYR